MNLYNGLKHSSGMRRLDDGYNLEYTHYRTGGLVDIMRVKEVNNQFIVGVRSQVIQKC